MRVWQNDYDLVDETILEAGMYTKVKPGVYHQFECLADGVAFELYWAEFNHNDIVRETVGHAGDEEESTLNFDGMADTPYFEYSLGSDTTVVAVDDGDIQLDWDNVTVDGKLT